MMRGQTSALVLAAALVQSACAGETPMPAARAPVATADPAGDVSGDLAVDLAANTAALLAMADQAQNAVERATFVNRLNALGVVLADGAPDDPLAGWRQEYAAANAHPPFRGRTLGPAYRRAQLGAGQSLRIEQIFYAGERANIAAQVSGNAEVAMAIVNPRAEPVCARNLAPSATCNWLPIFTERFVIELQNRSNAPASVYLVFR